MACDSSTKDWYSRRGVRQRTLTVSQGEVEVRIDAHLFFSTTRKKKKIEKRYSGSGLVPLQCRLRAAGCPLQYHG